MYKYNREIVEVCPHCDHENIYSENEEFPEQYVAICDNCGKKIFLCDECMHSEDNPEQNCDWCMKDGCDMCFRGKIENTKSYTVIYEETIVHTFTVDASDKEHARLLFENERMRGELDFSDGELVDAEVVNITEMGEE